MAVAVAERVAGVVLAGGEGKRIGGHKALLPLAGRPLVGHVVDRLAPQVDALWLSVRGAPEALAGLGIPLARDASDEAAGPLAGIAAGVAAAAATSFPLVAVVPCDTPFLPADLVARLAEGLAAAPAIIVGGDRRHPTIGLWRTSALPAIAVALGAGNRSVDRLCRAIGAAVLVPPAAWPADALVNVNTAEDLAAAERRLSGSATAPA